MPRLTGGAAGALAIGLLLAACSAPPARDDPITGQRAETPSASADPTAGPTPSRTPVVPPARPTDFTDDLPAGALRFRDYLGASVPSGSAGPSTVAAGTASGWRRDAAGAVLAAAHVAVALDARQPRALWRPVVDGAVPRGQVAGLRARTERAATAWDARLEADERARAERPSDGDAGLGPPSVWRPPVRIVGYSELRENGRTARVVVWARSDGTARWLRRPVRLRWARGDWRLRLPATNGWTAARPDPDVRPIGELSS